MIFAEGSLALVFVALWLFCLIDVITTSESDVRNLPKMAWLFIVLLLPDIGSIAWLVAGRNWQQGPSGHGRATSVRGYPEYDRPGRHVPASPDDDEAFLRQVRERANAQRGEYQARRQAELQAEHDRLHKRPEAD
ncbi:MAG: PLD nuclease N-terminal domain-containing protein [Jatrophihabitantaceae bacterium]